MPLKKSLLFTFAHTFRPLVSFVFMLIPPILGWLCPKGQVTRAQEAEENYLVKRELATVKHQSEEASAELEQAKKLIRQLQQQQQQQQPSAVRRAPAFLTGRPWLRTSRRAARCTETGMFLRSTLLSAVMTPLSPFCSWLAEKGFQFKSYAPQFSPHSNPDYAFCHVSHWLWVISLHFTMHDSILGHTILHSSATIYSIIGNATICFSVVGWQRVLSLAELFMCKQIADASVYELCFIFESEKNMMKTDDLVFLKHNNASKRDCFKWWEGSRVEACHHLQCCFFPSALTNSCSVVEGTPAVLWGVGATARERARAGPFKGGRIPMCPQRNAR